MGVLGEERVQFEQALADLLALYGSGSVGSITPSRLRVINLVKAKIDEIVPEGEGIIFTLESEPNISNPLDLLISAVLDEAAKQTLLMAPLSLLEPTISNETTGVQLTTDDYGKTGYIVLPENFLRLISFKMTEWERPANIPVQVTSAEYFMQKNKFVRGGISKPVVAITWKALGTPTPEPKKILEYYSVKTAHGIDHFHYVPETLAEDVQSNLVDTMTWICAAKILLITERPEHAAKAQEQVAFTLNNL